MAHLDSNAASKVWLRYFPIVYLHAHPAGRMEIDFDNVDLADRFETICRRFEIMEGQRRGSRGVCVLRTTSENPYASGKEGTMFVLANEYQAGTDVKMSQKLLLWIDQVTQDWIAALGELVDPRKTAEPLPILLQVADSTFSLSSPVGALRQGHLGMRSIAEQYGWWPGALVIAPFMRGLEGDPVVFTLDDSWESVEALLPKKHPAVANHYTASKKGGDV